MRDEIKTKLVGFFILLCGVPLWAQYADALSEYRKGNYLAAVEICQKEIAENQDNIESHVVICWSFLKLGRYTEAAEYASAVARKARYDVRVIEILGEIDYFQGRNSTALQYFQEYVNLAPEGQRIDMVYYYMGEIYIRLGRFRHADIAISTALHYVPNSAHWWARIGYIREMLGENREALRAYNQALELNASLTDARRGQERLRSTLTQ
ncbi:MAG: hypothetical protein LBD22_00950 [Spirochaetaceae bacterium]|jgi:tetratricopeptide (TPR) repeat protein|nr:hypothetical protein [Spirochaetaceae bacterium]